MHPRPSKNKCKSTTEIRGKTFQHDLSEICFNNLSTVMIFFKITTALKKNYLKNIVSTLYK